MLTCNFFINFTFYKRLTKETTNKMKIETTQRGFEIVRFTDRYDEKCSIQKSSLASEAAIWFGIDNPKLTVFENKQKGNYLVSEMPENFSVSSRMHLTIDQVKELLPILQNFVETGELS